MYNIQTTRATPMKIGFENEMRVKVAMTPEKANNNILRLNGKVLSTESISLEKRLRILPRGLASKKLIGALRIAFKSLWCISLEAIVQATARVIVTPITDTPV